MTRWLRTPEGEPSIHAQAMANLRRLGKIGGLAFGGIFVGLALFIAVGAWIVNQQAPSFQEARRQAESALASASPTAPTRTGSPSASAGSTAIRQGVVDFLTAAGDGGSNRWKALLAPGGRFVYSDSRERIVDPSTLTRSQETVLRDAVTRDRHVVPDSLAVSKDTSVHGRWQLGFVVRVRGKGWIEGEAAGVRMQGGVKVGRIVYGSAG